MGEPTVNQKLLEIAKWADKNANYGTAADNDGKILNSTQEIMLFDERVKLNNIDAKEAELFKANYSNQDEQSVTQILGGEFSNTQKAAAAATTQTTAAKTTAPAANKAPAAKTPIAMTKKNRDAVEDAVAKEVLRLAYAGKDKEGIINGLRTKFGAILELGDITTGKKDAQGNDIYKEGYTKDDLGGYVMEEVNGKKRIKLRPEYEAVIADVEKVYDTVAKFDARHQNHLPGVKTKRRYSPFLLGATTYNKGHKEAQEALKAELTESQKSFLNKTLRAMEDAAKNERVDAKYAPLKERFEQLVGTIDANAKAGTIPEYKATLDGMKARLKETKEFKDDDIKAAYKKLEQFAKTHAKELCSRLMNPKTGLVYASVKKDRAEGEKISHKDFRSTLRGMSEDPIFRDAIQDVKQDRKNLAKRATIEDKKVDNEFDMTYEEAVSELKKRLTVVGIEFKMAGGGQKLTNKLDAYRTKGKETSFDRSDDEYRFSAMVDGIVSRVGQDFILSRNDNDLQMAEVHNVKVYLEDICKQKFTDGEIRRLCHLAVIAVEHKDRSIGTFLKNLAAGLPLGVGAFANAVITSMYGATKAIGNKGQVLQENIQITSQTMDLIQDDILSEIGKDPLAIQNKLNEMTREQKFEWIKKTFGIDLAALAKIEDGKSYSISKVLNGEFGSQLQYSMQYVEYDNTTENAKRGARFAEHSINNLIFSIAIASLPALVSLAFGGDKNEESCVSVSDYAITERKYTNIDEYKAYVERRFAHNPEKVKAMQAFADACNAIAKQSNYEWHEIYNDMIREMAGYGSKLNWKECRGFKYADVDLSKYQNKTPAPEPAPAPAPAPKPAPQPAPKPAPQEPCDKDCQAKLMADLQHRVLAGDGWELLVRTYYSCLDKKDLSKAVAALKKLNGIKPSDSNLKGTLVLPSKLLGCNRDAQPDMKAYDKTRNENWAKWSKQKGVRTWHGSNGKPVFGFSDCDGKVHTYPTEKAARQAAADMGIKLN